MIDFDRDNDGNWYLVLEWLPDNLETVIERDGSLTWNEYWEQFGRPILDAIVFGQKKRIAHRDIKPKNILVTPDQPEHSLSRDCHAFAAVTVSVSRG